MAAIIGVRPVAASTNFKELKGWKQAQPRDHELPRKWWEIFKDPYLNGLEEQVNIANQSIAQAEAQFRQAQSLVQSAAAAYFPTATADASKVSQLIIFSSKEQNLTKEIVQIL